MKGTALSYFNESPTWIDIVEHEERLGERRRYILAAEGIREIQSDQQNLVAMKDPLNKGFACRITIGRVVRLAEYLIDLYPPAGRLYAAADPLEHLYHLHQIEFRAKYHYSYRPLNSVALSARFAEVFCGCEHFPTELLDSVLEVIRSTEHEREDDWWNEDEDENALTNPAGGTAARILGNLLAYSESCIDPRILPLEDSYSTWAAMPASDDMPPELWEYG